MNSTIRLSILAFLAAVIGAGPAAAQTKITLGYPPANFSMPAFVAKDHGIFAKHGLDVTLTLIPILPNIPAALVSNSVQVGVLTPPNLLLADEAGLDLQLVIGGATQTKEAPAGGVVARPGLDLKTAADFRGKKVGVPGLNTMAHIVFKKWLKERGTAPDQATYIEASFPQMGDMLKSNQIDAALVVEPFLGRIVGTHNGTLVSNFQVDVMSGHVETFYTMTKGFIQKNPQVAANFRAALREAVEWTNKNTQEARKTQVTYLKLPEEVAMSVKLPTYITDVTPQDMQFWIDLCKEFELTKGTATVSQVLWQP